MGPGLPLRAPRMKFLIAEMTLTHRPLSQALDALSEATSLTLASVPDGFDALVVADLARALAGAADGPAVLVHVARDGQRQQALQNALRFVAPEIEVLEFPAWDCQPYDRVSPNAGITAQRMTTLSRLARSRSSEERPRILSTTVNAARAARAAARPHRRRDASRPRPATWSTSTCSSAWLETNGFLRTGTVRDTGEYAVRGGILDLFPPGCRTPVRLDFFGDTLESIRTFDPETQRTTGQLRALDLVPMSEVQLDDRDHPPLPPALRRGVRRAVARRPALRGGERGPPLSPAWSTGCRCSTTGSTRCSTICPDAPVVLRRTRRGRGRRAPGADRGLLRRPARARWSARKPGVAPYKPLPPDALYLGRRGMGRARSRASRVARLTPFAVPRTRRPHRSSIAAARRGRNFAAERAEEGAQRLRCRRSRHIRDLQAAGQARDRRRLVGGLARAARATSSHDHGLRRRKPGRAPGRRARGCRGPRSPLAVLRPRSGLRDRRPRGHRRAGHPRRPAGAAEAQGASARRTFIAEVAALDARRPRRPCRSRHRPLRRACKTIEAAGAPHDCLELHYAGGDRLFLPVENIELLTRYGSEETEVQLDRLGGGAWQARKARHEAAHPRDGGRS